MRAVSITGKKQLSVIQADTPMADGRKVIIKISRVGICGTDLHLWKTGESMGLVMGHEFCGTVVHPGELEGNLKVGDRVAALPMDPCGVCPPCKSGLFNLCVTGLSNVPGVGVPGAFAEYFASRPDMVRRLPDSISDNEAAMLEPAAVALRAVHQAGVKPGDKVLVTGGGIIGVLSAAWARIAGASYIALTEINKARAENASRFGDADQVFDANNRELAQELLDASKGGFDQVLECTSVGPAINTALATIKTHGRVVLVGANFEGAVPIPTIMILLKEVHLQGTLGYNREFDLCLDLFSRKAIDAGRYISDVVPLEDAQSACERLTSGSNPDIKILLDPGK